MEIGKIQPVPNSLNQMNQHSQYSGTSKLEDKVNKDEQVKQEPALTEKEVIQAVDGLNRMIDVNQTHIKFNYHEKLGEYYVQIIDDQKNEVIREIPSSKILDIVADMKKSIGVLFDIKI